MNRLMKITYRDFVFITWRLREERYVEWPYALDLNVTKGLPFTPYRAMDFLFDLIYDNDNGDLR